MRMKMENGIVWYSGKGSQSLILPDVDSYEKILVNSNKPSYGRAWGITTSENMGKLLQKNRYLYEIITDRKRKVYFDVDKLIGKGNPENWSLRLCRDEIKKILPEAELQISGSVRSKMAEDPDSDSTQQIFLEKHSYHIVVSNYFLENTRECGGIKGFCKSLEHLGFDWKVYTKNRAMKCINQTKPEKENRAIQAYVSGSKNPVDHLITANLDLVKKDAYLAFQSFEDADVPVVYNRKKQIRKQLPLEDIKRTTNIELLKHLDPADCDHPISWTVAKYVCKIGLEFKDFWEWAAPKNPAEYRLVKWKTIHWPTIVTQTENGYNTIDRDSIMRILERTYPNIRKDYYTRVLLDNADVKTDFDFKTQYLEADIIEQIETKIVYAVSPMGSGKTNAITELLGRNTEKSTALLNCRKSLAKNIISRLDDSFVDYNNKTELNKIYRKETGLKTTGTSNATIKRKALENQRRVVITPHSCHYLNPEIQYETLVIDEFEMFMASMTDVQTHTVTIDKKLVCNFQKNFDTIVRLINKAKKIIIMDAIPSLNAIGFFVRLGYKREDITVVNSSFKYPKTQLTIVKDIKDFIATIVQKIRENKKVYVFWPYVAPKTDRELENDAKLKRMSQFQFCEYVEGYIDREIKTVVYNATLCKHKDMLNTLSNVNNNWKDVDLLVVNQCITVGVNFDIPNIFDCVFLADANFVKLRELIQTSKRVRKTTTDMIYYTDLGGRTSDRIDITKLPNCHLIRLNAQAVHDEKLGNNKVTRDHLFSKNNTEVVLNDEYKKECKNVKSELDYIVKNDERYDWNFIGNIEDDDVYDRLIQTDTASIEDVLKTVKYKFRNLFTEDIPEYKIAELWESRSAIHRIHDFCTDDKHWLREIISKIKYKGKKNEIMGTEDDFAIRLLNLSGSKITLNETQKKFLKNNFIGSISSYKGDSNLFFTSLNTSIGLRLFKFSTDSGKYETDPDNIDILTAVHKFAKKIPENEECMFI